jgi:hypothetical protein
LIVRYSYKEKISRPVMPGGRVAVANTNAYANAQLSLSHFFKKLAFAAPDKGFPSLLTADSSQHFFNELALAAPANALPSLLTALVAQDCAAADPIAKAEMRRASARRFIRSSPLTRASRYYCDCDLLPTA